MAGNNSVYWDLEMVNLPQLAELYSAATGWETTVEDLKRLTMKQLNLEKAFNLRHTDGQSRFLLFLSVF
jgi:aldehyde:ferredoxin oxidoreductase